MSQSGAIGGVMGIKFGGYDHQNNELFYQGVLGTTKYIFDTEACEKYFGVKFGSVIEFMLDPTSPQFDPAANGSSKDHYGEMPTLKQQTFKDFLGRFFLPIGVMISPLSSEVAIAGSGSDQSKNHQTSETDPNKPSAIAEGHEEQEQEHTTAAVGGGRGGRRLSAANLNKNNLSLYAVDLHDLTVINLVEATTEHILHARYPCRIRDNNRDHGLFDSTPPNFPFGFSTTTLYAKYFVKAGEEVYLANLQDSATIVGEAFGCVWVALASKRGKIVPLPKATDETRLVNLYGLSDITNAPQPGQPTYGLPAISPRQIQTPRNNQGGAAAGGGGGGGGGPPFTLGKKTADGKAAVLCNCPMNQQVLAVCTQDALKEFDVKPMGRIFFALGVDAGKSATILGVRNGSLYIHVDGAAKCICLRNATNAKELREKYTGTDASASSGAPTSHFLSPAQTLPKKIDGPIAPPSTLPDEYKNNNNSNINNNNSRITKSPTSATSGGVFGSIPRLSLNRLGSGGGGEAGGTAASPSAAAGRNTFFPDSPSNSNFNSGGNNTRISPLPRQTSGGNLASRSSSPSSPVPKGFYHWTANGCLKFDISAEACGSFGVRHAQTHRFTSGPDAGSLFHIVGVHSGCLYVVQDHRQLAIPLRYCADEKDVKSRYGPSLISTTKLRSADPRGPAPSSQPVRSPDRRAGSPFGLSPRNYKPEAGEDVGNWGKEMPLLPRQKSDADLQTGGGGAGGGGFNNSSSSGTAGARSLSSREINFDSSAAAALSPSATLFRRNSSHFTSGVYEMHEVGAGGAGGSQNRLAISKSMSPQYLAANANNNNNNHLLGSGKFGSSSLSTTAAAAADQHPHNLATAASKNLLSTDFSISIGRQGRDKSPASHPLHPTAADVVGQHNHQYQQQQERGSSVAESASASVTDSIVRNTRIPPPRPVRHDAFKVGNMPSTRMYLKAIALRALGVKRESDMPTAFFRFFSHDAGLNLSRALREMPKFQTYWDQREKPMRGGRSFQEATTDMMVEALENLSQLRGES